MTGQVQDTVGKSNYHGVKVLTAILSSLCMLTVALALGLGHLYMMAVAIAAVPLVSYAVGKRMLAGLKVKREIPDVAWDNQPTDVKLRIHNRSSLPKYFVQAQDTLPRGADFGDGTGVIPLAIPPQRTQDATYQVVFQHRGRYQIGPLKIHATDPLGMFYFSHSLREQSEILVLPSPLPLPQLDILQGALYWAAGVHSAPVRGDSVEFLGIREYTAGDPLRRMDWKHSARYGELFVRDFERFTQTEVCVLLDCTALMRQAPNSFEIMVKAASGVLHLAYAGGLPFRLLMGSPEVDSRPARLTSDQLYSYLYALADVAPHADFSWFDLVAKAAAEVPSGTLLILLTASADARLSALLQVCARRSVQVVALLPNVPALDRQANFADALHDGEFLRALSTHNVLVIPLHPGGGA